MLVSSRYMEQATMKLESSSHDIGDLLEFRSTYSATPEDGEIRYRKYVRRKVN